MAALVAVVGLALFGEEPGRGLPRSSGDATAAPTPGGAAGSADPFRPTASEVLRPTLPDWPNTAIPGAPGIGLGTRRGDDVELSAWWPGRETFEPRGVLPDVFAGVDDFPDIEVSPNLRYAVVIGATAFADVASIRTRLIGPDGVVWERELAHDASVQSGGRPPVPWPTTTWSPDSTKVAFGGGPVWTIVYIDVNGAVTEVAVRVAPDADPTPSPGAGEGRPEAGTPVPFAFSADGRWLYGAASLDPVRTPWPAVRVDLAAPQPTVEPIGRYVANGPERLAPTGPSFPIDPTTGRIARWVSAVRGVRQLELFESDGTPVPLPDDLRGGILSATWIGDGRLFVLRTSRADPRWPVTVDTAMLEADGRLTPWRIVDGRLTEAQTIGGREGYVLVDLKAGAREMYVILRADDGASGTLPIRSTRGRFETWLYLIDPSTDG